MCKVWNWSVFLVLPVVVLYSFLRSCENSLLAPRWLRGLNDSQPHSQATNLKDAGNYNFCYGLNILCKLSSIGLPLPLSRTVSIRGFRRKECSDFRLGWRRVRRLRQTPRQLLYCTLSRSPSASTIRTCCPVLVPFVVSALGVSVLSVHSPPLPTTH